MSFSAHASFIGDSVSRDAAGKKISCVGVDVQSASDAPGAELLRFNCRAHDDMATALDLALELFGALAPSLEGLGEFVRVRHDLKDRAIIFSRIPGDADGADGDGHISSPLSINALREALRSGSIAEGFDVVAARRAWQPLNDIHGAPASFLAQRRAFTDFIIACAIALALAIAAVAKIIGAW
jgi:hypothetical protein